MIVEPKTPLGVPARDPRVDGTELAEQIVPGYGDDLGVWIEGVATDPRSATGRTVDPHPGVATARRDAADPPRDDRPPIRADVLTSVMTATYRRSRRRRTRGHETRSTT
jgi:hypothetical protein